MEEIIATKTVSEILRKLGFDKYCFCYYSNDKLLWQMKVTNTKLSKRKENKLDKRQEPTRVAAPTLCQVFKFFQDKYNCNISIIKRNNGMFDWEIMSHIYKEETVFESDGFITRKAALEGGVLQFLKDAKIDL